MKKYLKQLLTYLPSMLMLIPAITNILLIMFTGCIDALDRLQIEGHYVSIFLGLSLLLQISLPIFTAIFAYRNKVNAWLNILCLNIILWVFHHISALPLYSSGSFPINFVSLTVYIFPFILSPMLCISLLCAIIFSIIGTVKKCKKRRADLAKEQ